jgi:gliding motility-associated-like protein
MNRFYYPPAAGRKCQRTKNLILIKLSALFFYLLLSDTAGAQLVLNEVSQGVSGTKEYIELVVTGTKTCTDSTADIRGWIIDDNNGWLGAGTGQGIAQGCMRFSNNANWSKVPYGSIILIYNDGDKNSSIALADDPADANHDYVYILPASSSQLENNGSSPASPSAVNYVYPTSGFSPGGNWSRMGLANGGDGVVIVAPGNRGLAHFSFGYGSINNSVNATVYKSSSGSARCYYLTDHQFSLPSSWVAGSSPANETPGYFNSNANANWINGLRQISNNSVIRDTTQLTGCTSVVHNNITYTASVVLADTIRSVSGCDSVYQITNISIQPLTNISINPSGLLNLCSGDSVNLSAVAGLPGNYTYAWSPGGSTAASITVHAAGTYSVTVTNQAGCSATASQTIQTTAAVTENTVLNGCNSITFNGITYTSSTTLTDTLRSINNCDSIYRITAIVIQAVTPVVQNATVSGCGSLVFNGVTYTSSTSIRDTVRSIGGCDSVYRVTSIVLQPITPAVQNLSLKGCGSLVYNGITYLSSAIVEDTIKSTGGCDSVLIKANIKIDSGSTVNVTDSFYQGQFYSLPSGMNVNMPGVYTSILRNSNGCDSIINTTLLQIKINCPLNPPNVFTPNNDGYNDVWKVFSGTCFKKCKVSVYNRYGSLVYHTDNYNNDWDGRYKNNPLPDATYYYVIAVTHTDGRIQPFIGNVTIMR